MLSSAFAFKLEHTVLPGFVIVGKFDGKLPTLACATTGGKILLHSPHEGSQYSENQLPSIRMLNFNRKITSLAAGSLSDKASNDLLFTGTQSNLLAYDVDRNADVFFRDCPDGCNALALGKLTDLSQSMVFTGGNCSVLGFDSAGNEAFWTVTSDNISSMCLTDIDSDGAMELFVGSDDFEIRIFKKEELIGEITEADKITHLLSVGDNKFGYGLTNGTVGVYNNSKSRMWRVKTKHKPVAVIAYDINNDGVSEVISGWSNGSFNVRNSDNGEVLFRAALPSQVAGVVKSDYRLDGKEQLMVCTDTGDVRGYIPADAELVAAQQEYQLPSLHASEKHLDDSIDDKTVAPRSEDQRILNELQEKKLELLNDLKKLEQPNAKQNDSLASVSLTYELIPDEGGFLGLRITAADPEVQIVNIVAIDIEGGNLDGSDVAVFSPFQLGPSAFMTLKLTKNQSFELQLQTHITSRATLNQLYVIENKLKLPKFANFRCVGSSKDTPQTTGEINFTINDRIGKLDEWIRCSFITDSKYASYADKVKAYFVSNASGSGDGPEPIQLLAAYKMSENNETKKEAMVLVVRLRCNSMALAADIIQDLAKHFGITDLTTEVDFPNEFLKFEEILKRVEDCNSMRVRLAADMAEDSTRVKALIIRAEDSRIMTDMVSMRRAYTELHTYNNQLISGYNVRASNHENLLNALKEVNLMIQRAANLRVGAPKTVVVSECRAAVKVNNMKELLRIVKSGSKLVT